MSRGGILQGVAPSGDAVSLATTPEGRLKTRDDGHEVRETNRLLKKVIFLLELALGAEAPDLE